MQEVKNNGKSYTIFDPLISFESLLSKYSPLKLQLISLIVISLCFPISLDAQQCNLRFINFSYLDGLPDKAVYAFAQDDLGFIWVGTASGLYRYDGHVFKKFKSNIDTDSSQISNILQTVVFDKDNQRLWLKSMNDFQYFDLKDYSFNNFQVNLPNDVAISNIQKIIKSGKDKLLIPSSLGLLEYNINLNTTSLNQGLWKSLPNLTDHTIKNVIVVNDTLIALHNDHSVLIHNPHTLNTTLIPIDTVLVIRDMSYDPKRNALWLACFNEIYKVDLLSKNVSKIGIELNKAKSNTITNARIISMISDDVLFYNGATINVETNELTPYLNNEGPYDNQILYESAQFTDRQGNLWRGSYESVCSVLPFQNKWVHSYKAVNQVKGNLEVLGSLYLPSVDRLLLAGNEMKGFLYINTLNGSQEYINLGLDHRSKFTQDVIQTDNHLIFGSDQYAVYVIDIYKKELQPILKLKNNNSDGYATINTIFPYSDARILIHTTTNNYIYDATTKELITINDSVFPNKVNVYPLCVLNTGAIYYGSDDGIYIQSELNGPITKVEFNKNNTNRRILKVSDIKEDINHNIWIATLTNGVFIYNPNTKELTNFNKDNSLMKTDFVKSLAYDGKNEMIAGTATEVYRFDINKRKCFGIFKKQNGFSRDDQSYGVFVQNKRWLIKNNYGIVDILDLDNYTYNSVPRTPILTSLKVLGIEALKMPITKDTSLTFKYNETSISFSFASLNLTNSNLETYKYKLEGLDTSWIQTSTPHINYSRLPAGKYILIISASNNDGVDSIIPLSIVIIIEKIFYKSWWFILFSIGLISAGSYYIHVQKVKSIIKQQKLELLYEKKLAKVEMKALRAQMNPHFIFNSLNSIQSFIFKKDEYAASQYLTKFSRLIRLILDHSDQEFISLSSEIDHLNLYIEMESLRFDKSFDYEISVDPDLNLSAKIPSMVIQPHVENAIWHGLLHKNERGKISIMINKKDDQVIEIVIADNGVGRKMAAEFKSKKILSKKSYGSEISNDRIRIFNELHGIKSDFQVEDPVDDQGNSLGTRIVIQLAYLVNS